jgi:hypothetical protein
MTIRNDKTNRWLDERDIIDILINWEKNNGTYRLRAFWNIIYPPISFIDPEEGSNYIGYYVAKNIIRTEMGFDNSSKPGDFDIIVIPFSPTYIYFERSATYEVKIVRPSRSKPSKNANSLGITQLNGLIKDGFPLVSLIHICMTEPLLDSEKQAVKYNDVPMDIHVPNNKGLLDGAIDVLYDWFGIFSADKQMQRIISQDIPKYVGLFCASLNVYKDNHVDIESCSADFWNFQAGYFNPHVKQGTIEKIKIHFKNYRNKYMICNI